MKQRTAARVLLLNDRGEVLLIRFAFPQMAHMLHFWATPSGGVEGSETTLEAAQRELREELDIAVPLIGPVHHSGGTFEYDGELVSNHDVFYQAHWIGPTPTLAGITCLEKQAMQTVRWWSEAELKTTVETVYPQDIVAVLQRLQPQ